MPQPSRAKLLRDHQPAAIAARLRGGRAPQRVSDAVLGGIDGCITTFVIVAGSVGAGFPLYVALILGISNLFADGLSMAVSNYESIKAQNELIEATRASEAHHIEHVPEGEREEVRQIFAQKGFAGDTLERIVDTITGNRRLWIDTMLMEEHGLQGEHPSPLQSGMVTFAAFALVGALPLVPLLITPLGMPLQLYASMAVAAVVFFAIGSLKSLFLGRPAIRAGFATLLTGGTAALIAYLVGSLLRNWIGV